ncbi:MAG TPA: hypothetical protein ENK11_04400 [Phycisphaerales bacterium]|nr:hypothetical protein [Phycisphaerales bacterium]
MTGSSYIVAVLERTDEPAAGGIRTNWDDRILPEVGQEIDLYWTHEAPTGWANGAYVVRQIRPAVLDADPKMPKSQPSQLTIRLEMVV